MKFPVIVRAPAFQRFEGCGCIELLGPPPGSKKAAHRLNLDGLAKGLIKALAAEMFQRPRPCHLPAPLNFV